jgi:hypothetical protein
MDFNGAKKIILDNVKALGGSHNHNLYKKIFDKMGNKEFTTFMENLRDGKTILSIFTPIGDKDVDLTFEKILSKFKHINNYPIEQQLVVGPHKGVGDIHHIPKHIPMPKYLILKLPIRRTSQTLNKGISYAENNKKRNLMTGQTTGSDKSAKITKPEIELLGGEGFVDVTSELLKARGGDIGASNKMMSDLKERGSATLSETYHYATGVVSKKTTIAILNAAHIGSTESGRTK